MASGAQLNPHKSKAMAIGTWKTPAPLLGIHFHERVEILGVSFGHTTMLTSSDSWTRVISAVRAQARRSYMRNLHLAQRIQYVKMHLFAKLWFLAQFLLLNRTHAHQLTAIAMWFIWRGSIFKVPTTTMQLPKWEGGWDFPHVEIKCNALLYNRLQVNGAKRGTVMTGLMRKWAIEGPISNPPTAHALPPAFNYLQQYTLDMAYVSPQCASEARKSYKRRIYDTLHHMYTNGGHIG